MVSPVIYFQHIYGNFSQKKTSDWLREYDHVLMVRLYDYKIVAYINIENSEDFH